MPGLQGLGVQTGANPLALLRDPKLSLAEGAVSLWPSPSTHIFPLMLQAWSQATGVPSDVPFEQLGAAVAWSCTARASSGSTSFSLSLWERAGVRADTLWESRALTPSPSPATGGEREPPHLSLPVQGSLPCSRRRSRVSPGFRGRLEHLVDEVECSACGGGELRDDAAAVQFNGRTIDEMCRRPLGKLLEDFKAWKLDETERKIAGEVAREITSRLQFLVDVGLSYLTLAPARPDLSGGESQRIRLAAQVGNGLMRRALRARRADHRAPSPRQPSPVGRPPQAPRLGQHAPAGRHDREVIRMPTSCSTSGPAPGRDGGEIVGRDTPQQGRQAPRVGHGAVSLGHQGDRRADQRHSRRFRD